MRPILTRRGVLVDGTLIAKRIIREAGQRIDATRLKYDISEDPTLSIILTTRKPDMDSFLRQKRNSWALAKCKSNINIQHYELSEMGCTNKQGIIDFIRVQNEDSKVTGIQVYLPLSPFVSAAETPEVLQAISCDKDVEAAKPYKFVEILKDPIHNIDSSILPCIYLAVYEVLREYQVETRGKRCLMIGQEFSSIYTLSALMSKLGMYTSMWGVQYEEEDFLVKNKTKLEELKYLMSEADLIITGFGRSGILSHDHVMPNTVVVDLAINVDPLTKAIRGDFSHHQLLDRVSLITPVPKGVGPITTAMVFRNFSLLYQRQQEKLHKDKTTFFINSQVEEGRSAGRVLYDGGKECIKLLQKP